MDIFSNEQFVAYLYVSAYGRAPDYAGLNYWVGELSTKATANDVIKNFFFNVEGAAKYGSQVDNDTYFNNFYNMVLGRSPDSAGKNYWEGRSQELGSRDALFEEMILSVLGVVDVNRSVYLNKIDVALHYANVFGEKSNLQAGTDSNSMASIGNDIAYKSAVKAISDVDSSDSSVLVAKGHITSASNMNDPSAALLSYQPTSPTYAGPPPHIMLHNDNGLSSTDYVTSDGTVDVSLPAGVTFWQYSINGGMSWQSGIGSSFVLDKGTYPVGTVISRYADSSGVLSKPAILPEKIDVLAPLNLDNAQLEGFFSFSSSSAQFAVNNGIEWTPFDDDGFTLHVDISSNSIKVYAADPSKSIFFSGDQTLKISDIGNSLPAFKDVVIKNTDYFTSGNISVSDNELIISLSGIPVTNTGLEISLNG